MVGINDEGVKHPLFPSWHEWADEVKPAMRNSLILGAFENDPRTVYIAPKAKKKKAPDQLGYGEQLLQRYKASRPTASTLQKRSTSLRKLEALLFKADQFEGKPRYVLGLHGSVILNLDNDDSVVDAVILDRKYLDGSLPTSIKDEPRALHNLVHVHDILDGRRGLETMSLYGSSLQLLDHETGVRFNISLNALHLMYTTLLLRQYALMAPLKFLPLCHFVHRLLYAHLRSESQSRTDDNDDSRPPLLNSYAANLLVLFYLQTGSTPDKPFHVLHAPDAMARSRDGEWRLDLRIPREQTRDTWVGQVGFCWPLPAGWSLADKIARLEEDKEERKERQERRKQREEARLKRAFEVTRKRKLDDVQRNGRRPYKQPRISEEPTSRRCFSDSDDDDGDDDDGLAYDMLASTVIQTSSVSRVGSSAAREDTVANSSDDDGSSGEYDSDVEEIIIRRGFTFTDEDRRPPALPPAAAVLLKEEDQVESLLPMPDEDRPMREASLPAGANSTDQLAPSHQSTPSLGQMSHEPSPAPIPAHLKGKGRALDPPEHLDRPSQPQTFDCSPSPARSVTPRAPSMALPARELSPLPETVPELVNAAADLDEEIITLLDFIATLDPRTTPVRVQLGRASTRAEWERDRLQGMQKTRAAIGSFEDQVVIEDAIQKGWNVTPSLSSDALKSFSAGCEAVFMELADDEVKPLGSILKRVFAPAPVPPSQAMPPPAPPPAPRQPPPSHRPPPFSDPTAASRQAARPPPPPSHPSLPQPSRQQTPYDPTRVGAPPPKSPYLPPSPNQPGSSPRQPPRQQQQPRDKPSFAPSDRPRDPRLAPRPTAAETMPRAPSSSVIANAIAAHPPRPAAPAKAPAPTSFPPVAVARARSASPPPAPPPQVKPKRVWKAGTGQRGGPTAAPKL